MNIVLHPPQNILWLQAVHTEERARAKGIGTNAGTNPGTPSIQNRPLPDLPEKETVPPLPKLQMR